MDPLVHGGLLFSQELRIAFIFLLGLEGFIMSDLLLRPPVGSESVGSPAGAPAVESTIHGHVNTLKRSLSWIDVFFIASGVPALVLFSVGALADQVGTPACLIWALSVTMGFFQAFTYADRKSVV